MQAQIQQEHAMLKQFLTQLHDDIDALVETLEVMGNKKLWNDTQRALRTMNKVKLIPHAQLKKELLG